MKQYDVAYKYIFRQEKRFGKQTDKQIKTDKDDCCSASAFWGTPAVGSSAVCG